MFEISPRELVIFVIRKPDHQLHFRMYKCLTCFKTKRKVMGLGWMICLLVPCMHWRLAVGTD